MENQTNMQEFQKANQERADKKSTRKKPDTLEGINKAIRATLNERTKLDVKLESLYAKRNELVVNELDSIGLVELLSDPNKGAELKSIIKNFTKTQSAERRSAEPGATE